MQCFVSVLVAALVGGLWVDSGSWCFSGLWAVELDVLASTSHFPAVLGIHWVISRGQIGFLTVCHFSNFAGINCDKGFLFLHYLSLKEHMKKLKSRSNARSPIGVSLPFGVRTMVCAAQALEVSL